MNSIGFVEVIVISLLCWILLGPEKLGGFARSAGRMYKQISGFDRDYPLGSVKKPSESEKIRASAERLGVDTSGMNEKEMREEIIKKVEIEKK
mgnify:FL=1